MPLDHALLLEKALTEAGIPNRLYVEPNGIHMRFLMKDLIWNFLDGYLK